MERLRATMIDTLARLERRLIERAELARINAVLSVTDPALVLPSPAVALIEVECTRALALPPTAVFRSLEPLGPDGEVFFSPVRGASVVQPWRVSAVRRPEAERLEIDLERPEGAGVKPGPLTLAVGDGEAGGRALHEAQIYCGTTRLTCRPLAERMAEELAGELSPLSVVRHTLLALTSSVLELELPSSCSSRTELTLSLHLAPGAGPLLADPLPCVRANVLPVWNSLDDRCPAFGEIERTVGEERAGLVRGLPPRPGRERWMPWSVTRVGANGDESISFRCATHAGGSIDAPAESYRVAFVPAAAVSKHRSAGTGNELVLAIVLSRSAGERLRGNAQRFAADYRTTLGGALAEVEAGSEFQLVETSGYPMRETIRGRLLTGAIGGSDGLLSFRSDAGGDRKSDDSGLRCLLPVVSERSIGDVGQFVERTFGDELSLVDPTDLLHRADGDRVEPLDVRVRFHDPDRPAAEKAALLRSCRALLDRYLSGCRIGSGVTLREDAAAMTGHGTAEVKHARSA